MKAENIHTSPIEKTYKAGVMGSMVFVGVFLTAFILWSMACIGGAVYTML